MTEDVIDRLAGIAPGSALDAVRRHRMEARDQAQASFDALFTPIDARAMPVAERAAIALFVARLHGDAPGEALYGAMLDDPALRDAVRAEAAAIPGPYGAYPAGPLSAEDRPGPEWRSRLPGRLGAALAHTHMLVFHPRDAAPRHLQALVDAGWTTDGIVTLAQLVAFLSFQLRVAAGLRAMQAA